MAGSFSSNTAVSLHQVMLPEFFRDRCIPHLTTRIFDAPCRYDIIFRRDILHQLGLIIDFEENIITWDGRTIAMRNPAVTPFPTPPLATQLFLDEMENDLFATWDTNSSPPSNDETAFVSDNGNDQQQPHPDDEESQQGYKSKQIHASEYNGADVSDIAHSCTHLSLNQQNDLEELLLRYPTLFDGQLRAFTGGKIHLDIDTTVSPQRSRPYTVPHAHMDVFKQELDRLTSIGVLEPCGRSEWIAGTFIIPKRMAKYAGSLTSGHSTRPSNAKCTPSLELPTFLHVAPVTNSSPSLISPCNTTPLSLMMTAKNSAPSRLPLVFTTTADFPWESVSLQTLPKKSWRTLSATLHGTLKYIACFSNSWEHHINLLDCVLSRLQAAGFAINPRKCEWAVQETDFLGHWLTPIGIKPWKKKVNAILQMQPPKNLKQLRAFLGLVTYYRDMWPRRSHILAPLTNLTGRKFTWNATCQKAFDEMKAIISTDALLAYPDHNLPFHLETDASDYQLGAVIKQNNRPVAYYTRKLNPAQQNYTTIEKELLSVVETLREFRTMLLGAEIHIHTDHKNLTHKLSSYTTQRVLRWRLLIKEFGPKFHYKAGEANFIADALSRIPTANTTRTTCSQTPGGLPPCQGRVEDTNTIPFNDVELAECLLVYPGFDPQGRHPFHFKTLYNYQQQDNTVLQLPLVDPLHYFIQKLGTSELVCRKNGDQFKL